MKANLNLFPHCLRPLRRGDEFAEELGVFRDERDGGLTVHHVLRLDGLKQRVQHFFVLGDFLQGRAHNVRAHGGRFGKLDGGLSFRSAGDDAHLIRPGLFDGSGHLPQTVHHFFFNLLDHVVVAEMHLADIDGAEAVTPFAGFGRDFFAHGLAHGVAVLQHPVERQIAQATDSGVADVGSERTARVGVLEQIIGGVADVHLIPDADAHGCAFLGIDGLAAEIRLVETQIEFVAFAEDVHDERARSERAEEEMQAGFIQHGKHLAEQHVNFAVALVDDGVKAEQSRECEQHGHENRATDNGADECDEEVHDLASRSLRTATIADDHW